MGPKRDPAAAPAWNLYLEIVDLQEENAAGHMKTVISKAQEAVKIAPEEPDLLMLLAVALYPYQAFDKAAKRLMIDCQVKLDNIGGPSEFALAESGGREAYIQRRNLIAGVAGRKIKRMRA